MNDAVSAWQERLEGRTMVVGPDGLPYTVEQYLTLVAKANAGQSPQQLLRFAVAIREWADR
ncbi:hypothetical protein [Nocardia sp. CY41]|uniref:hypothetical protein n=1 Tax=Nocardia sp. CY41 TaxID=2608686 RepID=UPI0013590302|nr:hypothetical protein [Nocardia sp. CY41]